jgi:class 3 adenylate cyclase
MKTHVKTLLNVISVSLILLSCLLFFTYVMYTADVRRRLLSLQRGTAAFILSHFDERIQAIRSVRETSGDSLAGSQDLEEVIRGAAQAVAGYYDRAEDDQRILVFDTAAGTVIYPESGRPEVDPALYGETAEMLEGPVFMEDRFGYFVRYTASAPYRIGVFVFTDVGDAFRMRNRLLYVVCGLAGLFTLLTVIVVLRVFGKWRRFIGVLKGSIDAVLNGRNSAPRRIAGRFEIELRDYLTVHNELVERLESSMAKSTGAIEELTRQRDNLTKITHLYRKYIPQDSLTKLDDQHVDDVASRRQHVVSLSVELIDFVKPTGDLYPQIITNELSNFVTYVKTLAVRRGGVLNVSRGYRVNLVFGVPASGPEDYHNALIAARDLSAWVGERNSSEMNVSGIPWNLRMGLSAGEAVTGIVGQSFMALGDVTVRSGQMIGYARRYRVGLVSDDVSLLESSDFATRKLDVVHEAGGDGPVTLFQVFLGRLPMIEQAVRLYQHGLDMFYEKRYEMAVLDFKKVLTILPDDGPSTILMRRCEEAIKT